MVQEFLYHVPWHSHSIGSGNHTGYHNGSGIDFHSHAPLTHHPDARHLDLQASLRDPFGQFQVRRYRQTSRLNVMAITDLSASLHSFGKYPLLIDICQSIAWSACRHGDRFAFCAAAEQPEPAFYTPPTQHYNTLQPLWQLLKHYTPTGRHSRGLLALEQQLPAQRSLIFVISDFHLPIPEIEAFFRRLQGHDVVPLILWHYKEYEDLPLWRFIKLHDPETRQMRSLWMRPSLKKAIQQRFKARSEALKQCCTRFGRQPLFIHDQYQADQLTHYFLGTT